VGNRPPGGCVFGERSKPKTVDRQTTSAKPKRPKRRACWFCRCVLAIQLSACADAIHQESLAVGCPPYVSNPSWRSVQTFLVLLHTEAGGTPAFQSASASRKFFPCREAANLCGTTRGKPTLLTKLVWCNGALFLRVLCLFCAAVFYGVYVYFFDFVGGHF
jgi:hypothetical protein